jgi:hypothetical protein
MAMATPLMRPLSYVIYCSPLVFFCAKRLYGQNTTFLRGIQQTADDGAAQFQSIFPGHYSGRTRHIHILVHSNNGTLFSNGTYVSSTVSHVGQLFFDQSLGDAVEKYAPYNANTQSLTENEDDSILAEQADGIDPLLEYALLGDDLSDGILAWGAMGIDLSAGAAYTVQNAAVLTEDGGVMVSGGSGGGGMSGGPAPSGGMPSGAMPSGFSAPSSATASVASSLLSSAATASSTSVAPVFSSAATPAPSVKPTSTISSSSFGRSSSFAPSAPSQPPSHPNRPSQPGTPGQPGQGKMHGQ